jgi:hypothetical protein
MPFVFVIFLIWIEWILSYDLQSEEMQLVGQWAPLVGAGLVLVAAFVGKYWPEERECCSDFAKGGSW